MKYLFRLLPLWLVLSCTSETKQPATDEVTDFTAFYTRFHQDSIFQLEHILFPLQGLPSNADSAQLLDRDFRWQQADWVMHHPIPANSDFSSKLLPVDEALVIEQIMHRSGDYAIERRFAKINDQWLLIYYAGLNRVKKAAAPEAE